MPWCYEKCPSRYAWNQVVLTFNLSPPYSPIFGAKNKGISIETYLLSKSRVWISEYLWSQINIIRLGLCMMLQED
jgi:hypothetical protein